MPDCARCNRPLGVTNRRCKVCGACEHCCECYGSEELPEMFTPAELGLDPEHYDAAFYDRPWKNRRSPDA